MKNEIVLLIKQMSGGGAERVVSLLATELSKRGYHSTVVLTHQSIKEADLSRLNDSVKVISIEDELKGSALIQSSISINTTKAIEITIQRLIYMFDALMIPCIYLISIANQQIASKD